MFSNEKRISLSPTEFKLLHQLASHAGQAVSRETLLNNIWGYQPVGKARILHTSIRRLREKIERNPDEPEHVVTVLGVGYKLVPVIESDGVSM